MIYTVTLNPAVDISIHVKKTLKAGGVNKSTSLRTDPGGKGVNVSKTLKVLGRKSVICTAICGDDGEAFLGMLKALGFTAEDAMARFGYLINAFRYGAPPHGGLAYGLDRIVMHLANTESIRDVIAFPKVQNASELMTDAPDFVDDKQLKELSIKTDIEE